MSLPTTDDAARVLADPRAYTDDAVLHAALAHLRANAPVSWVDQPGYQPFWAVTKHADITAVEKADNIFTNGPRPVLVSAELDEMHTQASVSTLIHMDGDRHRAIRAIGADWFRPKAMRQLKLRVEELARMHVDQMIDAGPDCDFVQEVAVKYPLYVIMSLLGVPEADFSMMLRLTQELVGGNDEELRRRDDDGRLASLLEMFEYFNRLVAMRRAEPTGDLGSAIANATIEGRPLTDVDTVSYFVIIATAGHDTTSATISGGMQALIEHPDQLGRLRADRDLMGTATEEMIRWVTPVKAFMRTAQEDVVIRGVSVKAGESVLLSYPSANRDEDVFDDPFRFDVGRERNRHIAFGHGVHFCLGAALARMEVGAFYAELLPRLRTIEITGSPELVATTFVGGLKHLPIHFTVDAALVGDRLPVRLHHRRQGDQDCLDG